MINRPYYRFSVCSIKFSVILSVPNKADYGLTIAEKSLIILIFCLIVENGDIKLFIQERIVKI